MINTKEQITQKEFQKKYGGEIIKGKLVFNSSADFSGCTSLISIPEGTVFNNSADFSGCTSLISIPEGTVFNGSADFSGCTSLISIPEGTVFSGYANFRGCTSLISIPEGTVFSGYADFSGCTSLISIPKGTVFNGSANFSGCTSLISIPEGTVFNNSVYFSGCTSLRPIPKHLIKVKNLYIFPNINWNNIEWINKILGDKLTAEEVFAIDNIEHRRIAYQYMDKAKMKTLKDFTVLDEETDNKGNPMKIVSFTIQNMKEQLLFYNCFCPSSKKEYFIQTEKKKCSEAKMASFGLKDVEWGDEW